MRKTISCCALTLFLFCASVHADLVLKITTSDADKVLSVGDTTWMTLWGWVDDLAPSSTNGLASWQTNVVPGGSGSVMVTTGFLTAGVEDIELLAPAPLEPSPGVPAWTSVNSPSGDITDLNAFLDFDEMSSVAGVGTGDGDIDNPANYTKLADFRIEALTEGTIVYSLESIVGDLVDFTVLTTSFYADGSDVLTIVPEPTSLLILSGLGMIGYLCRKK